MTVQRPLRVLHAIDSLRHGGAQSLLLEMIEQTDRLTDVEQHLLVISGEDAAPALVDRAAARTRSLTILDRPSLRDGRLVEETTATLDRVRPDLVHSHLVTSTVATRIAARRRRRAHVTTIHTPPGRHSEDSAGRGLAEALTSRLSDAHIAPSASVARAYAQRRVLDPGRLSVIRNPAPRPAMNAALSPGELRERIAPDSERELVVLCVARLVPEKGVADLIEAAFLLREEPVRILIAGDGPDMEALRQRVATLNLDRSVELLGRRDDVGQVLAACDAFCLPSHYEGAPVALLEAMAAGLPSVVTDVGGIPEIVVDGRNGLLVPAGVPDALAGGILRLALDRELAVSLGGAAAATAGLLSPEAAVRDHLDLYRSVVASAAGHVALAPIARQAALR